MKEFKAGDIIKPKKEHLKKIKEIILRMDHRQHEIDRMSERAYFDFKLLWDFIHEIHPEVKGYLASYEKDEERISVTRKLTETEMKIYEKDAYLLKLIKIAKDKGEL